MKNKARPLSVERLGFNSKIQIQWKRTLRLIKRNRLYFGLPNRYSRYKKINQLNDDCN